MIQYPAKLLLFGEYSIIYGSQALSIPLKMFYGYWDFSKEDPNDNHSLLEVYQFLKDSRLDYLDLKALKQDIDKGIFFNSNIPIGYGLGSSGALCAGILDKYKTQEVLSWNSLRIQKELANIESYFHGKSSGLDPLISYLNRSILVKGLGSLKIIQETNVPNGLITYLLDSGQPRKTESLVNSFISKCQDPAYLKAIEEEYIPLVNKCVDKWLEEDTNVLADIIKLSKLQINHFTDYIPDNIKSVWEEILQQDNCAIKLCGAGGGGFFLLFSNKPLDDFKGLKLIRVL